MYLYHQYSTTHNKTHLSWVFAEAEADTTATRNAQKTTRVLYTNMIYKEKQQNIIEKSVTH